MSRWFPTDGDPEWAAVGAEPKPPHRDGWTGPTSEAVACETAVTMAQRGYRNVRVLRRASPDAEWVYVAAPAAPNRLTRLHTRHHAVYRGRH